MTSLNKRISNVTGSEELKIRRIKIMSLVALSQMMPAGAIKGGTAMKIRMGEATSRFSRDLDISRKSDLQTFTDELQETLISGWNGFTGVLLSLDLPFPKDVPADYVMVPYRVKLNYKGSAWTSVILEVGHDEIQDTLDVEYEMAPEIIDLFTAVGLPAPTPVPLLAPKHQISQKLHAASEPGSSRAHDLVDLQLLEAHRTLDLAEVNDTCHRLFEFRRKIKWPPTIQENENWASLYSEAAVGMNVLPEVDQAIIWANNFIQRINAS